MNKSKASLILPLLLFLAYGCEGTQTSNNVQQLRPPTEIIKPKKIPLNKGEATFKKPNQKPKKFSIEIKNSGHKGFFPKTGQPSFIVEWSDGYTSAYEIFSYNTGKVYDYDEKTKKWSSGDEMNWKYEDENFVTVSGNGKVVTTFGDQAQAIKQLMSNFHAAQKEQKNINEALAEEERKAKRLRLKKERMYIDMDLALLDKEFKENRIRARKNYEGKIVTVKGQIDGIYDDKFTVCQESRECVEIIYGLHKNRVINWLSERNQGDRVTVTGTFNINAALGEQQAYLVDWNASTGYTEPLTPPD